MLTNRSPPFWSVATSNLILTFDSGLISPMDFSSLCLGALGECWEVFFEPLSDFLVISLVSSFDWLLRAKPPLLEVVANGSNGEIDPVNLLDELTDCFPGPEGEGKFKLIGNFFGNVRSGTDDR